jgi:predicted TIM-barrel fold metal-dependent hydrolase
MTAKSNDSLLTDFKEGDFSMKIITVEEHFESKKINQAIRDQSGQAVVPEMSQEMQAYMSHELPNWRVLQDTTRYRLKFMDRYGIDLQLLSYGNSSPQNLAPANAIPLCQQANDELARVIATQPTRFAGLAVLPVGDPTAAATELKRAVTQLGFKGALLKGNFQGKFFDEEMFFPLFAMASQLDVPVYLHPSFIPPEIAQHYFAHSNWSETVTGILATAGFGWHMDSGIQVMRLILSGIFDKLPNLKIISGHWGEFIPYFLERLDDELTAFVKLEKPFSTYYRQNVYVSPSGILSEPQLRFLKDELGPEHLLYSLDYPYKQPAKSNSFLQTKILSANEKEMFAHQNAEKIFHLV